MQSRDDDHIVAHIGARLALDIGDGATDEKLLQFKYFLGNLAAGEIRSASSIRRWLWVPTGVSALLGLAALSWFLFIRNPEVRFWIGTPQHSGEVYALLDASSDVETVLGFPSSGSEIVLGNDAKAMMVESTEKAVRLELSSGDVNADINGNGTTRWSIGAGRFEVVVMGTRFSVSWNPEREQLDIRVQEGTVRVLETLDTKAHENAIYATEGEHLRIDGTGFMAKNKLDSVNYDASEMGLVRSSHNGGPNPTAGDITVAFRTASQPDVALRTPTIEPGDSELSDGNSDYSSPESRRPKGEYSADSLRSKRFGASFAEGNGVETGGFTHRRNQKRWRKRLKKGEQEEVLQEVDATGLDALVETIDAESLWQLMNAARRIGRDDIAINMLIACRERFPGTYKAGLSAFVLGTQYQKQGSLYNASRWFDIYLDENPNGEFASEAKGRTMGIYQQWGDERRARAAARRYLREDRDGPFGHIARSILGQ